MPVTLYPIDRRRFLTGAMGALAFAGELSAETPRPGSLDCWALLSDTHIPADREKTGGRPAVKPVEHLAAVRKDVLSGECGRPGGVLVTGDCAYLHGLPGDYRTILQEFAPFRKAELPVHFLMGNHDNRRAFLEEVAREIDEKPPSPIPPRLCSIVETPRANFFLMDSLDRTDHSPGLFGDEQLDWLSDELDRRKDKPAVLFGHHYPDYSSAILKNPHALQDTTAFFDRIKNRMQVKAYIFGHAHRWNVLHTHGIHLVNLPATSWRFESRQPYAWVLATFRDDGVRLQVRSIDREHPDHNKVVDLAWRTPEKIS